MHVCKKYPDALGGDATVVAHLERMQRASANEVVILTTNCQEVLNGASIYKVGLGTKASSLDRITLRRLISLCALLYRSFRILKTEKPDIIHTHSPDMLLAVSFAARHYGVPIVHTCHVVTFNDLRQSFVRRKSELSLIKWARPRIVTAPNPFYVEDLKCAGISHVSVLPNGVDMDLWQCDRTAAADGEFTFVGVGRLERQKGFEYLLKATALLKREAVRFRVVVVGEGSERDGLVALAQRLGISGVVAFLGKLDQPSVKQVYAESDAMVISSLWESTPLTLLEAWACRLPVISTSTGMLQQSIGLKAGAYVVPPEDDVALAEAMHRVMADTDLATLMAERGYDEVAGKYTWVSVNEVAERVYEEALL
jgi:glycosyltransferase involved in cell wall biosynthesis